jgi:hypothetical protein
VVAPLFNQGPKAGRLGFRPRRYGLFALLHQIGEKCLRQIFRDFIRKGRKNFKRECIGALPATKNQERLRRLLGLNLPVLKQIRGEPEVQGQPLNPMFFKRDPLLACSISPTPEPEQSLARRFLVDSCHNSGKNGDQRTLGLPALHLHDISASLAAFHLSNRAKICQFGGSELAIRWQAIKGLPECLWRLSQMGEEQGTQATPVGVLQPVLAIQVVRKLVNDIDCTLAHLGKTFAHVSFELVVAGLGLLCERCFAPS